MKCPLMGIEVINPDKCDAQTTIREYPRCTAKCNLIEHKTFLKKIKEAYKLQEVSK